MSVILDLPYTLCIWISAAVAIVYTLMGGLYSVAYTDVIQLTLIFISLVSSYIENNFFQNLEISSEYAHFKMCTSVVHCLFLQWLCVPFVLTNPHSADITKTAFNFTYQAPWIGSVDGDTAWRWIDHFLLLVRTTFSNFVKLLGLITCGY